MPGKDGPTESSAAILGYAGVLSVDGHEWDTDPFVLIEEGGKLCDRGTCDMRGFALCVAPMPRHTTMRHSKPVHFTFLSDDERNCAGVSYLADYPRSYGFEANCLLIGDGCLDVST